MRKKKETNPKTVELFLLAAIVGIGTGLFLYLSLPPAIRPHEGLLPVLFALAVLLLFLGILEFFKYRNREP